MIVLREGAHLDGLLARVEAKHFFDHKCVCNAVRQMMESAELMSHGVAYAEEGVCESHTCHGGGISHLLSRLDVVGAVVIGSGQILKYSFD